MKARVSQEIQNETEVVLVDFEQKTAELVQTVSQNPAPIQENTQVQNTQLNPQESRVTENTDVQATEDTSEQSGTTIQENTQEQNEQGQIQEGQVTDSADVQATEDTSVQSRTTQTNAQEQNAQESQLENSASLQATEDTSVQSPTTQTNAQATNLVVLNEQRVPLSSPNTELEDEISVYYSQSASPMNVAISLQEVEVLNPRISIERENIAIDKVYSNEIMPFRISINNQLKEGNKESRDLEGAYLEISLPNDYLMQKTSWKEENKGEKIDRTSLTVPSASLIKDDAINKNSVYAKDLLKQEYIDHNANGTTTVKVPLSTITKTTSGSFTMNVRLEPRIAPNGYKIAPILKLYDKNGNILKVYDKDNNLKDYYQDEELGSMSVKYEKPQLYKSVVFQDNYKDDTFVYAGNSGAGNNIIDNSEQDVAFFYTLTTASKIENTSYDENGVKDKNAPQGFRRTQYNGSGLYQTRLLDSIKITENIPYYINSEGNKVLAVFDQAKNPNWQIVQDENGKATKVSMVVNKKQNGNQITGADISLREDVRLILTFPDFKAFYDDGSSTEVLAHKVPSEYKYSSETIAELAPVNESQDEINDKISIKDELRYILSVDSYSMSGMMSKSFVRDYSKVEKVLTDKGTVKNLLNAVAVDDGNMHLETANFRVSIKNNQLYPIKKVVIRDFGYDERFFVKHIIWEKIKQGSTFADKQAYIDGFDGVYGIKENGSEEKIIGTDSIEKLQQLGSKYNSTIESDTQQALMQNPNANLSSKYKAIEFRMKEDFELKVGQEIHLYVQMGFTQPSKLTEYVGKDDSLKNRATLLADMQVNGNTIALNKKVQSSSREKYRFDVSSSIRLYKKLYSATMTANTINNKSGSNGEMIYLDSHMDLRSLPKNQEYKNPYFVVMIPDSLTKNERLTGINKYGYYALTPDASRNGFMDKFYEGEKIDHAGHIYPKATEKEIVYNNKKYTMFIYDLKDITISDIDEYGIKGRDNFHLRFYSNINPKSVPQSLIDKYQDKYGDANTMYTFFYADNLETNLNNADAMNNSDTVMNNDMSNTVIQNLGQALGKDISSNQNVLLSSSTKYIAKLPTEIKAEKYIATEQDKQANNWKQNDDFISTGYDENFYYKLDVINRDTQEIKDFMLYDILPYENDKNSSIQFANSKFANKLIDKVQVENEDNFNIYYYVGNDTPSQDEKTYLDTNKKFKLDTNWIQNPDDYTKVKAIFITLKDDKYIEPMQTISFIVPMKAPSEEVGISGKTAVNAFTMSSNKEATFGKSNYVVNKITNSTIRILYKDADTKQEIETQEIKRGVSGENYNITADNKDIQGYKKLGLIGEEKGKEKGKFEIGEKTFTYWYKKQGQIEVKHIEIAIDDVLDNGTIVYKNLNTNLNNANSKHTDDVDKPFSTKSIIDNLTNYRLVDVKLDNTDAQDAVNTTFKRDNQTITYRYIKQGTVKVRYLKLDENGNFTNEEISPNDSLDKKDVGIPYDTKDKRIDIAGYEYVKVNPAKASEQGKYIDGELVVEYGYKQVEKVGKITVKHLLVDESGNILGKLKDDETSSKKIGEAYTTSILSGIDSVTNVDYDNYDARHDTNSSPVNGVYEEQEKEIVYLYTLKQGNVEVRYIVVDENNNPTGEVLRDDSSDYIIGKVGFDYNTEQKIFDGYTFKAINTAKDSVSGKITRTTKQVEYWYSKNTETPQVPPVTPPSTPDESPAEPNTTIPNENPPTNVPFVPSDIINTERIPDNVTDPILTIVDEDDTPLGNAIVNVEDGTYTFVEEGVPLGVAKINNYNTLEIIEINEDEVAKSLPKTGHQNNNLLYALGVSMLALAIIIRKKNRKKN